MLESFKHVRKLLIANDLFSYSLGKKLKAASKVASQRAAKNTPGEKEDTGWRTTENGKYYQINENGDVVKGPKAMKGTNVNKPSTWKSGAAGGSSGTAGSTAKAKAPAKKASIQPIQMGPKVSKGNPFEHDIKYSIPTTLTRELLCISEHSTF